MKRNYLKAGIFIVVILMSALGIRLLLLSGSSVTSQVPNDLEHSVTQAVTSSSPTVNKNFTVTNVHYFEHKSWLVATIAPKDSELAENDLVILQVQNGVYTVILGPGSIFPISSLENIPGSVKEYLIQSGNTLN